MSYKIKEGEEFGRLLIIKVFRNEKSIQQCLCRCKCGNNPTIRLHRILAGQTKCANCYAYKGTDFPIPKITKRIQKIFDSAKARCSNKKCPKYPRYGGRGIKMIWQSVHEFAKDMGEPPIGMSLERIDNNGNYSKENCRWATSKEQANNRSTNVLITYNGITKNLSQWSALVNLDRNCIKRRIRRGWTIKDTLEKPSQARVKDDIY